MSSRISVSKETKRMLEDLAEADESVEDVILSLADREEFDEDDEDE